MLRWILVMCIVAQLLLIQGNRMRDQITVEMSDVRHYCFRLLNGSTTVGCQSERTGNMGALALINEPSDLKEEIASLPYGISQIIAIVYMQKLSQALLDDLRKIDAVAGVLLIELKDHNLAHFSEDSVCPNEIFSAIKDRGGSTTIILSDINELQACQWNLKGAIHPQGLRFLSFQKPIFLLTNETEIDLILEKCYQAFNFKRGNHRCMGKMIQFMRADGNAEICMRRQQLGIDLCDPLQDNNIIGVLPPQYATDQKTNMFMLSARMDSFSTFTNGDGGDISVLTSVIALLAVADAIGQNLNIFLEESEKSKRQLLLAFFHGESMGYIGSSKMVWEMEHNIFPRKPRNFSSSIANIKQIHLDDIGAFFELQQLQLSKNLHMHSSFEVYSRNSTMIDQMTTTVDNWAKLKNLGFRFHKERSVPFPPSSYHSFLKKTTTIPGVLLTSYADSFRSGHINSILDIDIMNDHEHRSQLSNYIQAAASGALESALTYIFNNNTLAHPFMVRSEYVNELMDCFFTADFHCPLFQTLLNSTNVFVNARYSFIGTDGSVSLIRVLIHALLVRSLGEKWAAPNVSTESQCSDLNKNQNVYHFVWQIDFKTQRPYCYRTNIYITDAKSPAFDESEYDFRSGKYSTWMESVWDAHSRFELYLKSDIRLDLYAVGTALVVILLSIPLKIMLKESWFIDSNEPPSSPRQL